MNAEYGNDGYTGTSGAQPSGGSTVGPWKTLTHAFTVLNSYEINPGTFVTLAIAGRKDDVSDIPIVHSFSQLGEGFPIFVPAQINVIYDQTWSEADTPVMIDPEGLVGFVFNGSILEPSSRFDGTPPGGSQLQRGIILRGASVSGAIRIVPNSQAGAPVGIPPGNSFERIHFEDNGTSIYVHNAHTQGGNVPTFHLSVNLCGFTTSTSYQVASHSHMRIVQNSNSDGFPSSTFSVTNSLFSTSPSAGSFETGIRIESVGPLPTVATCGDLTVGSLITGNVTGCEFLGFASIAGGPFQGIEYGIHSLADDWNAGVLLTVSECLFEDLGTNAIHFGRREYGSCLLSVSDATVRNCGEAVNPNSQLPVPLEERGSGIVAWSEPGNTCTTPTAGQASQITLTVTDSLIVSNGMHGILLHHRLAGLVPQVLPAVGSTTALTVTKNTIHQNGAPALEAGSGLKAWIEQGMLNISSRVDRNVVSENLEHGLDFHGEAGTAGSGWPIEINCVVASNEVVHSGIGTSGTHYGIRSRYAGRFPSFDPGGLQIVQNTLIKNATADILFEVVGAGNDSAFAVMGNLAPEPPSPPGLMNNFLGFSPSPRQPLTQIDHNFGRFDQTSLNGNGCNATLTLLDNWEETYFEDFLGGDYRLVLHPPGVTPPNPAVDRVPQGIPGQGNLDISGSNPRVHDIPDVNACVPKTDSDSGAHELQS